MDDATPRYPIYIPSVGRAGNTPTTDCFDEYGLSYTLVVEPQERDAYAREYGADCLLVLPEPGPGHATYARNYILDHAEAEGVKRYWQIDDNIRNYKRVHEGELTVCDPHEALRCAEEFSDRFTNVGMTSFHHQNWATYEQKPYTLNNGCCWSMLCLTDLPFRWRGPTAQDVDFSLQVLAEGLCTVRINAFAVDKVTTGTMSGGHTDGVYQEEGHEMKRTRVLQSRWPNVFDVRVNNDRARPDFVGVWSSFDHDLQPADD